MNEVIVTVGPRGAGKSSFCEKVIAHDPSIVYESRDALLLELFGRTHLVPYSFEPHRAYKEYWKRIAAHVHNPANTRLIADVWNGSSAERQGIVRLLRRLDVPCITAWYFETPLEFVEEWFWQKPGIAKMRDLLVPAYKDFSFYPDDAARWDYALFHKHAANIEFDGFDNIVRIHPVDADLQGVLNR